VPAFRVKLGTIDLNCIGVPLNPTHSLAELGLWHSYKMGWFNHSPGLETKNCSIYLKEPYRSLESWSCILGLTLLAR